MRRGETDGDGAGGGRREVPLPRGGAEWDIKIRLPWKLVKKERNTFEERGKRTIYFSYLFPFFCFYIIPHLLMLSGGIEILLGHLQHTHELRDSKQGENKCSSPADLMGPTE